MKGQGIDVGVLHSLNYFFLWYMLHKALANGVASRSKYVGVLWPVLACSWDNLRSLWSRSNLHSNRHNFSPFAHLIQINASFARAKKRYNFVFSEEFSDSRYPVYAMLFKSITLGWSASRQGNGYEAQRRLVFRFLFALLVFNIQKHTYEITFYLSFFNFHFASF